MIVKILNKKNFDWLMEHSKVTDENVEKCNTICLISINDSCGTIEVPYFKQNHKNVLVLFFDDVVKDTWVSMNPEDKVGLTAKKFTVEQGKQIIDFIKKNKDCTECIVHCAAGISRSGAVGEFINDIYGEDYFAFKARHPWIHPNVEVKSILKKLWYDEHYSD